MTAVFLQFLTSGNLGSAQSSTISLRVNNTTDTQISTGAQLNQVVTAYNRTDLSIAVSAGDYFEIKWTTPTWAPNPTNVRLAIVVYIE